MKNLYISGITGRVGTLLADKVMDDGFFKLIGGSSSRTGKNVGKDIGLLLNRESLNINVDSDYPTDREIDIIVDFSFADSSLDLLNKYRKKGIPVLIGTTGFTRSQLDEIKQISKDLPVLFAPNTSAGIAILKKILSHSKNVIAQDSIINITETHHAEKKDSPSGTAIDIKEILSKAFNKADINILSYREGLSPGEHTVSFEMDKEIISISHKALDRSIFANGALTGAKWLINKPAGMYSMLDIYSS